MGNCPRSEANCNLESIWTTYEVLAGTVAEENIWRRWRKCPETKEVPYGSKKDVRKSESVRERERANNPGGEREIESILTRWKWGD
jgi:hypothetical protein